MLAGMEPLARLIWLVSPYNSEAGKLAVVL
jgi:hypothetical protein